MAYRTEERQQNGHHSAAPGSTIEVRNPVSDGVIGSIPVQSADAVADAVRKARAAQPAWAKLPVRERGRRLRQWANLLWEGKAEIIQRIREENGKAYAGAYSEVLWMDVLVSYYKRTAPQVLKPAARTPLLPLVQQAKVYHKPHGVVGIIAPWNYPLALTFVDAVPALMAGNAVVIKPSEITPFTALHAVKMMHAAGIPEAVVQVVTGDGQTGAALVPLVDYVSFTGSTATGRRVGALAAEHLIPFSLELGGKDPMIVLQDANLRLAASGAVIGAMENSGQACVSIERVYVEAPVYAAFLDEVTALVKQMTLGAGDGFETHMGSLTNLREVERCERHISDALSKGARLLWGGRRRPELGPFFFEPTVLADVSHAMLVMQEETFGPLLPIMPVTDADTAIRLANDSPYGLSAAIYTKDLHRAQALARQLLCGDVHINRTQVNIATPSLPMGGRKHSGIGRRNGHEGLLRYTTTQTIMTDTLFGARASVAQLDPLSLRLMHGLRRVYRWLAPF